MMKGFRIGNLRVKLPIIQGGMGVCISGANLAAAVANEGGVGVISAVGIGMKEEGYRNHFRESNIRCLKNEIRQARKMTDGIIGVNLMMAVSDFDDLLLVAIEEAVDIVFIGAGLPLRIPSCIDKEKIKKSKTLFIPKASSAKATKLIFDFWYQRYSRVPDGVVIEGPLSGGHQGFKKKDLLEGNKHLGTILKNTKGILQHYEKMFSKKIPLIAAGGIYYGEDIFDAFSWGADAVKMGTRFVTTEECDAHIRFKETYLNASSENIAIIDSPVGMPARVIRNAFVDNIIKGEKKPVVCPWKCLKTCDYKEVNFCIAEALFNAAQGNMKDGFAFAGAKAYQAKKIQTVAKCIEQLKLEYALCDQHFGVAI
jgi:nitronate monooxygenase